MSTQKCNDCGVDLDASQVGRHRNWHYDEDRKIKALERSLAQAEANIQQLDLGIQRLAQRLR